MPFHGPYLVEHGGCLVEKEEEGDVWNDAVCLPKSVFRTRSPAVLGELNTCLPTGSGNEFLVLLYLLKCLYLNTWPWGFLPILHPPRAGSSEGTQGAALWYLVTGWG